MAFAFRFAEVGSALASLRLTVVLFALSIFLVFAGTLAQVDHGVWDVVNHSYFRVWFAYIELQGFERLVQMFCPGNALAPRRRILFSWRQSARNAADDQSARRSRRALQGRGQRNPPGSRLRDNRGRCR